MYIVFGQDTSYVTICRHLELVYSIHDPNVAWGPLLDFRNIIHNTKPQRDIKRKTCDIRTWKKRLFLDISSTNIDKIVPLLYQCFETRSIEVLLSVVSANSAPGRASSATSERP
jgi:hypothetical protein